LRGQRAARGRQVHADDAAAGRPQQLHGEQAEQAQADHADGLTQLRAGLAHTLQGDGPQRGESGLVQADLVGDVRGQVARHVDDLGVDRVAAARAGHAIAGCEARGARAHGQHDPGRRVAQRAERIEPGGHFLVSGLQAELARGLQHLAHLVGARERLAEQVLARDGDLGALGARADQRIGGAHEQPFRPQAGSRDLGDREPAGALLLDDLFHGFKV
jgi:hypothetical protein